MKVTCQLTVVSNSEKVAKELIKIEELIADVKIVHVSFLKDALEIELKQELEQDELIMLGALIGRIDACNV